MRRTDRLPFAPPTQWASFEALVRNGPQHTDTVRLDLLSDDARPELKDASALTESLGSTAPTRTELDWSDSPVRGLHKASLTARWYRQMRENG